VRGASYNAAGQNQEGASTMRRLLIACLLGLACLLADGGAVRAQQLRFPGTGDHFFIVNVQPGWVTNEDKVNGGLQVLPKERWGAIYLALANEPRLAGKPLLELARGISQSAKITLSSREEAASISGKPGRAFYGTMINANGTELAARIVIIPVATVVFATATTLTTKSLTPAQQGSLDQAFNAIELNK
jgi:hypothetical protein